MVSVQRTRLPLRYRGTPLICSAPPHSAEMQQLLPGVRSIEEPPRPTGREIPLLRVGTSRVVVLSS